MAEKMTPVVAKVLPEEKAAFAAATQLVVAGLFAGLPLCLFPQYACLSPHLTDAARFPLIYLLPGRLAARRMGTLHLR